MWEDCGSAKHGTIRISGFDPDIMRYSNKNVNKKQAAYRLSVFGWDHFFFAFANAALRAASNPVTLTGP